MIALKVIERNNPEAIKPFLPVDYQRNISFEMQQNGQLLNRLNAPRSSLAE